MNREVRSEHSGVLPAVFFVSFAAIGWQLALMRCLLISRYHHFSFLVISCALLGFGAAGTLLALAGKRIEGRWGSVFRWGVLALGLSLPICFRVGELLPLNVYFPPMELGWTLGLWCLFWLIHLIPFLLAGGLIGMALIYAKQGSHVVYGWNLAGSAAGALGAIVMMEYVPANGLVVPFAVMVLLSGLFVLPSPRVRMRRTYTGILSVGALILIATPLIGIDTIFPLGIDQYKTLAHVQRLQQQGQAQRKQVFSGPRGRIELFESPTFHTLLSVGSTGTPPRMDMILRDGFLAGVVPMVEGNRDQAFLLGSLAALPYKLIKPDRVLILGESGGVYLQLAGLSAARSIVFVQPDRNILRVLKEHPSRVLEDPRVRVVVAEPRAYLDGARETFDIIHMAALEGFSPGSGGIGGLREDYLATVEGFGRCLDRLTPDGLACTIRGIQDPPRDNIKIVATWIEALEYHGVKRPGDCLLTARDELGFETLAGKEPLPPDRVQRFVEVSKEMSLDTDWFPGVRPEQTNRVHLLPGPAGTEVSWYHRAIGELLSQDRPNFFSSWIWNVRPATDDRPFFPDFFRWSSVSRLRDTFGPLWPARAEMGFLVLILAAVWTAVVAAVLLPLPLLVFRRRRIDLPSEMTLFVLIYFAALGISFMFVEMSFIQILTRFLGDPIPAAALVLGGFLFFAGVGSIMQPKLTGQMPGGILTVTVLIACLLVTDSLLLPLMFQETALLEDGVKVLLGLVVIAPLAILMGNPFPWGLSLLRMRAPEAKPEAWAVNGFVSVISACLAVLLAMTYGFKALLALAAMFYIVAGVVSLLTSTRYGQCRKEEKRP